MTGPARQALLHALAQQPEGAPVSLPRLAKPLGLGASAVLRELTWLGDAVIGGTPGPGWVRVWQHEGRWLAVLTDAGRAQCRLQGLIAPEK